MDEPSAEKPLIKGLLVIDLPHSDNVKVGDWEWKRQHFFPAENCDRQLLIGFKEDLQHVPRVILDAAINDPDHYSGAKALVAHGEDAYKHLLRVASGMLDKRPGEKKTMQAIRANWSHFLSSAANEAERSRRQERFGPVVKAFMDDSKTLRARLFEDKQAGFFLHAVSTEPAVAARNLIRPGKRDSALMICEKDGITTNTFKVLDNCASTLHLTHPDPAKCDEYANQFRRMGYKSTIEVVPYDEALGERLGEFRLVFNCQPMDNASKDDAMITAWRTHSNPGATLVHLKGNPLVRNATSEAWKAKRPGGVVFIEDILEQKKRDLAHNSEILGQAETAIANSIASRRQGRRPVDTVNKSTGVTHLLDHPSAYEELVQGAVRKASQFKRQPVRPHSERAPNAGHTPYLT